MKRPWIFLLNPFLIATEFSFQLAVRISIVHDRALLALQGDPFFDELYNYYHPFHTALMIAYNKWRVQCDIKTAKTLAMHVLLRQLSNDKISEWDIAIQSVYKNNTPQYKALLPKKRNPFQSGKYFNRINAVKCLGIALTGDASLANVKQDVDSFFTIIENASVEQKTATTNANVLSNTLELKRIEMCDAQYSDLGALIKHNNTNPLLTGDFFDLNTIRNPLQTFFTKIIKPETIYFICKRTLESSDKIKIVNLGETELKFYLSDSKTALPGVEAFTIAAGTQQIIDASKLGNLDNLFLLAYNTSKTYKGEFELEMI